MPRVYFEEVQRFRDNRWIWIISLLISIATLLPLVNGVYRQLIQGDKWGNKPMSDTGLLLLFIFIVVSWSLLMFMLFTIKLEVRIDEDGIHYRFFPIKPGWQLITKERIAEYKFEKRFRLFDAGGLGYHRNRLTNSRSFRISGFKHLYLKLSDNAKFRIGTQNLEGMEWAMNRLMKKNEYF